MKNIKMRYSTEPRDMQKNICKNICKNIYQEYM